ncbi:MAG: divergent polysaccharide deacetylase family protein, partial [Campylobacteraceae bacterium]|nr:divergent polysaccharide deacetylase family protein [Campylobacteraceae bacterium]
MIRTPRKNTQKRRRKTKKSKTTNFYIIGAAVVILALISIIAAMLHMMQKPSDVIHVNISSNQTISPPNTTLLPDENASHVDIPPIVPPKIETKPKLVIIIDDVAFPKQAEKILSIPLHVTPSFLPPKIEAPFSEELAQKCEFYMVHLPLEAANFKRAEKITLLTSDSYEVILEKLKKIKEQFPRAIYYNNHTG